MKTIFQLDVAVAVGIAFWVFVAYVIVRAT